MTRRGCGCCGCCLEVGLNETADAGDVLTHTFSVADSTDNYRLRLYVEAVDAWKSIDGWDPDTETYGSSPQATWETYASEHAAAKYDVPWLGLDAKLAQEASDAGLLGLTQVETDLNAWRTTFGGQIQTDYDAAVDDMETVAFFNGLNYAVKVRNDAVQAAVFPSGRPHYVVNSADMGTWSSIYTAGLRMGNVNDGYQDVEDTYTDISNSEVTDQASGDALLALCQNLSDFMQYVIDEATAVKDAYDDLDTVAKPTGVYVQWDGFIADDTHTRLQREKGTQAFGHADWFEKTTLQYIPTGVKSNSYNPSGAKVRQDVDFSIWLVEDHTEGSFTRDLVVYECFGESGPTRDPTYSGSVRTVMDTKPMLQRVNSGASLAAPTADPVINVTIPNNGVNQFTVYCCRYKWGKTSKDPISDTTITCTPTPLKHPEPISDRRYRQKFALTSSGATDSTFGTKDLYEYGDKTTGIGGSECCYDDFSIDRTYTSHDLAKLQESEADTVCEFGSSSGTPWGNTSLTRTAWEAGESDVDGNRLQEPIRSAPMDEAFYWEVGAISFPIAFVTAKTGNPRVTESAVLTINNPPHDCDDPTEPADTDENYPASYIADPTQFAIVPEDLIFGSLVWKSTVTENFEGETETATTTNHSTSAASFNFNDDIVTWNAAFVASDDGEVEDDGSSTKMRNKYRGTIEIVSDTQTGSSNFTNTCGDYDVDTDDTRNAKTMYGEYTATWSQNNV